MQDPGIRGYSIRRLVTIGAVVILTKNRVLFAVMRPRRDGYAKGSPS